MTELKMYKNCAITEYENIISGAGGVKRKIYEIHHMNSHEMLHTVSLADAFRMARLLDLNDVLLSGFFNCECDLDGG